MEPAIPINITYGKHQKNDYAMKHGSVFFLLIFFFAGCDYSYQRKIVGDYYLRAVNSPVTMDIGFGTSEVSEVLVKQTVFEIHWNDEFILAKRHPSEGLNYESIIRHDIEFYIIKKVKYGEEKASQNIEGPMNKEKFEKRKVELGLREEKMKSITFDNLK